jgi:Tol biopolymer transport system component
MVCIRRIGGVVATCPVAGEALAWSPSGDRLAFTASLDGQQGWDIYTMDSQGGSITRVTRSSLREWTASWAPDGRRLAVWRDGPDGRGHVIVTMNLDESGVKTLTDTSEVATFPRWGPGK